MKYILNQKEIKVDTGNGRIAVFKNYKQEARVRFAVALSAGHCCFTKIRMFNSCQAHPKRISLPRKFIQ